MRTTAYVLLAVLAVSAMATAQEESGIYGVVRALSPDGLYGDAVSNAVVSAVDGEGRTVARSVTGPNGAYRLVVRPGSYRLISQHPAYASFDTGSTVLLVQDGHFTLFNIGLEPKAAGIGSITGQVLSASGEPAVGAVVVVLRQDGEEVARVDTGPEGGFAIELVPGSYLLSAEHPLLGTSDSIDLSVEERETAEVELTLTSPAEVPGGFQGLVRVQAEGGAAGRPIAGAEVTATGEGGFSQKVTTNEIGFYKLNLPAGSYRLTVTHPDFEPETSGGEPLVAEDETVRAWNVLLRSRAPLAGVQTCRSQFPFQVGSSYGESHTIYLSVRNPGVLTLEYRWSGDANQLALIARGPDGVPRRVDGTSPLRLTISLGAELVALGFQWELSVRNFGGGRADGTLVVSYPCDK